jgi:hypothetical protein
MKVGSPTFVGWRGMLILIVLLAGVLTPAYCQSSAISLYVQQTPDEGGATNPMSGIYHFVPNSEVTLTATPSPGFKFVYWLGDVSNPQANSTIVHLDEPKIVVAVFEQSEGGFSGGGIPGGGGGLTATGGNLSMPGSLSSTTGAKPQTQTVAYSPSGNNSPEVPEPATGLLLALGSMLFLKKSRRNRINNHQK